MDENLLQYAQQEFNLPHDVVRLPSEGKFYKSNLNYNKVGNSASDKQINFIKQLKPQTTKAMQDKVDSLNFDDLKAKDASKLIEDLTTKMNWLENRL